MIKLFIWFLEAEEEGIAPQFVPPIKPKVVEENKQSFLECRAIGTPAPRVLWFKGEKEIKSDKKHTIQYNSETGDAKLIVHETNINDEQIYKVKAINKFGTAECRANLILQKSVEVIKPTVVEAPKFVKPIKAQIVSSKDHVNLDAEFEGIPEPEITWYRNGKTIISTAEIQIKTQNYRTNLYIAPSCKQKSGNYEVRAVNDGGEAKSSCSVKVSDDEEMKKVKAPRFIKPLKPEIVTPGEVVILETIVEAFPTATFQWFMQSRPILSSEEVRINSAENKSVLILQSVSKEQIGLYTCRAENVGGSATCTANIAILEEEVHEKIVEFSSPYFTEKIKPVIVMDGEKVTLTCKITGKPTPRIKWLHNEKEIEEAKHISISQDTEGLCELCIEEVFPENAGEYICEATNKFGKATCKTTVVVEGIYLEYYFIVL